MRNRNHRLKFFSRLVGLVVTAIVIASLLLFVFFPSSDIRAVIDEETSSTALNFKKLPAYTIVAIVAAEDERFFEHYGLDFSAVKKSLLEALYTGTAPKGASTITQQVIKNVYLHAERAYLRKFVEVIGALRVDFEYDKEEILLAYLKIAEFGPHIFGLNKASEFYFARKYTELSTMQSIFLASLLPAPTALNRGDKCEDFAMHFKKLWYRVGTATFVAMDTPLLSSGRRSAYDVVNILRGTSVSSLKRDLSNLPNVSLNLLYSMKDPVLVEQLTMLADQFSEDADKLPCMEFAKSLMRSAKDWAAFSKYSG